MRKSLSVGLEREGRRWKLSLSSTDAGLLERLQAYIQSECKHLDMLILNVASPFGKPKSEKANGEADCGELRDITVKNLDNV